MQATKPAHRPGSRSAWIALAIVAVLGLAAIFAAGMVLASQPGKRPPAGGAAPDFTLALYPGFQGGLTETVKLSDLRGRVVVLNFWASWCVECVKETDALESVWRDYRERGVVVLGVDYLDTESAAYAYLRDFDVTFPNGIDLQQSISRLYRITGVPETFFIDRNGVVRAIVIQALTRQELASQIEALLAE